MVGMNKHSNRHTPQREVQVAFKVLMTHWFCNSHDVSHFAAFFIDMGAKTSVAESVFSLILMGCVSKHTRQLLKIKIRSTFEMLLIKMGISRDATNLSLVTWDAIVGSGVVRRLHFLLFSDAAPACRSTLRLASEEVW